MFPPQSPPMNGMSGMGGMSAGTPGPSGPGGFAGSLGMDPSTPAPPQIDPALVQMLLAQLQADGLEGGMNPEAQAMIPLDPMAGMMGLSSQMPGMDPGMGMGGMGMPGMGGMGGMPPAFAQAQQIAGSRPQAATPY